MTTDESSAHHPAVQRVRRSALRDRRAGAERRRDHQRSARSTRSHPHRELLGTTARRVAVPWRDSRHRTRDHTASGNSRRPVSTADRDQRRERPGRNPDRQRSGRTARRTLGVGRAEGGPRRGFDVVHRDGDQPRQPPHRRERHGRRHRSSPQVRDRTATRSARGRTGLGVQSQRQGQTTVVGECDPACDSDRRGQSFGQSERDRHLHPEATTQPRPSHRRRSAVDHRSLGSGVLGRIPRRPCRTAGQEGRRRKLAGGSQTRPVGVDRLHHGPNRRGVRRSGAPTTDPHRHSDRQRTPADRRVERRRRRGAARRTGPRPLRARSLGSRLREPEGSLRPARRPLRRVHRTTRRRSRR